MTILVVRHGETDGNAARILQRPDIPLNERGMRQAEQLARRLFADGFVHILCSDLLRARMTAVPLSACSGITIEESPLLQERDFGDLRGVPYAELTENPFGPDFVPPNGEDWPRFHARVAEAFALILSRRRGVYGTLVVVTHVLVCQALIQRHALVPEGISVPATFDNTSVTGLHEDAPHVVSLINCTGHLMTSVRNGSCRSPSLGMSEIRFERPFAATQRYVRSRVKNGSTRHNLRTTRMTPQRTCITVTAVQRRSRGAPAGSVQ